MEELKKLYEEYERKLGEARKKAPMFSGVLGIGDTVKNHPCHMEFYEGVEAWAREFADSHPEPEQVTEALRWILADRDEKNPTCWYCQAAHIHAQILIPLLPEQDRRELALWYDGCWPKRRRLPVQNDVYKKLKK